MAITGLSWWTNYSTAYQSVKHVYTIGRRTHLFSVVHMNKRIIRKCDFGDTFSVQTAKAHISPYILAVWSWSLLLVGTFTVSDNNETDSEALIRLRMRSLIRAFAVRICTTFAWRISNYSDLIITWHGILIYLSLSYGYKSEDGKTYKTNNIKGNLTSSQAFTCAHVRAVKRRILDLLRFG